MEEKKIFSVTEINNIIKGIFDEVPLFNRILIRGEISNYKLYPSGHRYFTLKDNESSMRCVLFKGNAQGLAFDLQDGMKVIIEGRISVYPRDGGYQLYANTITADGVGDLFVAFEQLKEKLSKEGLFNESHKKPLPKYPKKICIITSSAGAAVHDMMRILNKRYPIAQVVLLPVRVQGVEAPGEIVEAIQYANDFNVADVIITGRGGGSIEDLWAFNDEGVARAIYASKIPVISAVGHEPDVTISDFVADRRASTPSNAAEIVVPNSDDLIQYLTSLNLEMGQDVRRILLNKKQRLTMLSQNKALTDPLYAIHENQMRLDAYTNQLDLIWQNQKAIRESKFRTLASTLDAMSPLKVLGRGYSITQDASGNVIKSSDSVSEGDDIMVRLEQGKLQCKVERKY